MKLNLQNTMIIVVTTLLLSACGGDDNKKTPATPATPATPVTPVTPVTPATPVTPVNKLEKCDIGLKALAKGDKITALENNTKLRVIHNENGSKKACVLNGHAKIN